MQRRTFLRAAGVSVALPWLESIDARSSTDLPPPSPRRAVFICTALGLHAPALYPSDAGADYEQTPHLRPLAEHRDRLTLFSGLSHPDQGGEHETLFTWLSGARNPGQDGFRNSISIDQLAAAKLGYITRFPSIVLSTEGPMSQSFTSSGVMIPAESSPSRLFAKLFLRGKPSDVQRERQKLREGSSILDALAVQTKALMREASAPDRHKLERHLESIRESERELQAALTWTGRPKPRVSTSAPTDIPDKTDLIGRIRRLFGLIPLILQTDSSRVVSVVIQDHHVIPRIEGVFSEHHNLSHHGKDRAKIDQLLKIEQAIVECFGDLLTRLHSTRDTRGSLLEQTMVLFGSNLGNANSHDPRNLPILLAGGDLQHGKYVAFDSDSNTPLSNLFVRILHEMNLDVESFSTSSGRLTW